MSIASFRQLLADVTPHPGAGLHFFTGYLPKSGKHAAGHAGQRYARRQRARR